MRKTVTAMAMAALGLCGVAQAQEGAQQPSRPVFSLPPGDPPEERPDPTVQGPRAPGMAPPRAIDPDAPREQVPTTRQTETRTRPQAPAAQPETAPTRNARSAAPPVVTRGAPARGEARAAPAPDAPVAAAPQTDALADVTGDLTGGESLFDLGPERAAPAEGDSAAAAAAPAAEAETGFAPIWLIGLALLLAGGIGYLAWQRRARSVPETGLAAAPAFAPEPSPEPAPEAESEPAPVAGTAPPAIAPAPATEPAPAQLELEFEPIEARWSEQGLAIKFRLYLHNISDQPVHDVAVHLGIRSAAQDIGASQGPAGLPNLFLETLKGHDVSAHEGEMRLDDKAIQPVLAAGREMVLPVIDIMPRYRDSADNMRKIQVALLVGREHDPPAQRLAPLAVRTALGPSERLGCRMLALPGAAAPAAA